MKVALLGGSFNPIHNGHIQIALDLIEKKVVNEVWFIPCGEHAFDKSLASKKDRKEMIDLAIKNNSKFKLIDIELNSGKKSYSSETIKALKEKFSHDFYFVIGTDNLKDLSKWHNFSYIKENVNFILVNRGNFVPENVLGIKISYFLNMDNSVSSTKIRELVRKGKVITDLVPEKVAEYIKQMELYHEKLF